MTAKKVSTGQNDRGKMNGDGSGGKWIKRVGRETPRQDSPTPRVTPHAAVSAASATFDASASVSVARRRRQPRVRPRTTRIAAEARRMGYDDGGSDNHQRRQRAPPQRFLSIRACVAVRVAVRIRRGVAPAAGPSAVVRDGGSVGVGIVTLVEAHGAGVGGRIDCAPATGRDAFSEGYVHREEEHGLSERERRSREQAGADGLRKEHSGGKAKAGVA
ncbi:hypothetical protein C8J57DRAFT_1240153 [Mycena rebaudengoi]|nr:hypothetical protein C8J57DRAFT_1240153 [Mycena rebaudengoi]